MPMTQGRQYLNWVLAPIVDPTIETQVWGERPTIPLVRELLQRHAELPFYGARRFSGTRAQRNALWREYRNYVHQALSYFDAAVNVPDRSACLLLYYSLLNFAKAELLDTHTWQIMGQRISHGLSYNPTWAKKLTGDVVTVQSGGVFPLLYEKRAGRTIGTGQALKVQRLLANIPEVATQLMDSEIGSTAVYPIFHMIAFNASHSWSVLLNFTDIAHNDSTGKLFYKVFRQIRSSHPNWRDHFGMSRRSVGPVKIYESLEAVTNPGPGQFDPKGAATISWRLKDIVSAPLHTSADALITPSIYKSRMLPMPASLARYATIFYASSLVRYRPSLFDAQSCPQNAYLFDAIARECALPLLVDSLAALEGKPQLFYPDDALRL
jgi:hypothetical protein